MDGVSVVPCTETTIAAVCIVYKLQMVYVNSACASVCVRVSFLYDFPFCMTLWFVNLDRHFCEGLHFSG